MKLRDVKVNMDEIRKKEQELETRSREDEGSRLLIPFLMSFLDVFDFKMTCMYDGVTWLLFPG